MGDKGGWVSWALWSLQWKLQDNLSNDLGKYENKIFMLYVENLVRKVEYLGKTFLRA